MAQDPREAAEVTSFAQALVLNMGAVTQQAAMQAAADRSLQLGHPVVLDPVAAGASTVRRQFCLSLLQAGKVTVLRGNMSEIKALFREGSTGHGVVDAAAPDLVGEHNLTPAAQLARQASRQWGVVVAITGPVDLVSDGERCFAVRNGSPRMAQITGSGCMLTALIGAAVAASPREPLEAALAAVAAMGICGQLAAGKTAAAGGGNGTFRTFLLDAANLLTPEVFSREVRVTPV